METPTFTPLPETVVAQLNAASTATISYQLAKRGFGNTFMEGIAPLRPDLRLCGRAVTLRYIPVRADLLKNKQEDTNAQRQLIESIGAGEVLLIDARSTTASATIGNILSTRVQVRGACRRRANRSRRHADRIRGLDPTLVNRGGASRVCARGAEPGRLSIRARHRRGGQLAGGRQGRGAMVSAT